MKSSPRKLAALLLAIAGLAACATTSRYYLPDDPALAHEARGNCVPVKSGGAVLPVPGARGVGLHMVPRDRQLDIRLDALLDVGEHLRLLSPDLRLESVPAGDSIAVDLRAWHAHGARRGGATAYDEIVPLDATITGTPHDLGGGDTATVTLFVAEASPPLIPSAAYRVTLPGFETGAGVTPGRSFVVRRREDTAYISCVQ